MKPYPKFFNTAGPITPDSHYHIDPLARIDIEEVETLIYQQKYFILHAPRQTGKTSCLLALRNYLEKRQFYVVYANVGAIVGNNIEVVMKAIVNTIAYEATHAAGGNVPRTLLLQVVETASYVDCLQHYLTWLSGVLDCPMVLFLDEIDKLPSDALLCVLRQLRAGYVDRPLCFPQSVILCGERDVSACRIYTSDEEVLPGGSPYSIQAVSLHLKNFSQEEIRELCLQHTAETGQEFDRECFPLIWKATEGQPWLVNALGYEVTMEMKPNRDRSVRILPEMICEACERIIDRRDFPINCLSDKLHDNRVRRVIAPMLAGEDADQEKPLSVDNIQYVMDLGLVVSDKPLRISNAIYKEAIPRELIWGTESGLIQQAAWYIRPDNSIDMMKLLLDFQQFFRQNADSWIEKFDYKESGPQLLLQAFLQRVVNGGGYIDREYGLGRGRTDLLITKPLTEGYGGPVQRIVLELKIKRGDQEQLIARGLEQTAGYMDRCAPDAEGHFILFNRDKDIPWDEKIWHRPAEYAGRTIMVWGM